VVVLVQSRRPACDGHREWQTAAIAAGLNPHHIRGMGPLRRIGVVASTLLASSAWAQPSSGRVNILQREAALGRQESLAARAPIEALRSASWFESAAVGIAGRTPATVRAWQKVARGKAPAAVFASLLNSDSAAARLYGLVGLYVFDRQAFTQAAAQERARGDSVFTLIGCIASQRATAPLVDEIATGSWSRDFQSATLGSR
jgi:hypothetical protein